jgi:hypothetical protein
MTARLASEKAWTATRRLKEVTSGKLCFSSGRLLEDPMGELTLSIKAKVKKKGWEKKAFGVADGPCQEAPRAWRSHVGGVSNFDKL